MNQYFKNFYEGLNPADYIDIPDKIRDLLWEAYNDNGVVVNTNKLYEAYQLCNSAYIILKEHEYQIEADNAEMNGENGFSLLYRINDDEYHAIQSMYEICEIYHKYFKFFDTSQIKSNQVETIEQEEAIQESESFDYIIDNDPEHENWHISVLESKLKQGKDKLMVLYVCINELYNNLCQLEKIGIDTDKDLFIYRFTGLVKQGASFLPSEKIKWYGKNVLLGHIIRCLTSDNKYYPEKMEIAAEFFESKTGKKINLASARHVNVSNFEDEKDSIDPNFVEAVELLRKCGFINAEYTSRRRETLQYRKKNGRTQN
jgi:hypothetical protein